MDSIERCWQPPRLDRFLARQHQNNLKTLAKLVDQPRHPQRAHSHACNQVRLWKKGEQPPNLKRIQQKIYYSKRKRLFIVSKDQPIRIASKKQRAQKQRLAFQLRKEINAIQACLQSRNAVN